MELSVLINHIRGLTMADTDDKALLLSSLVEEVGEVATALAVERGHKYKVLTESIEDECVDVIISALAIIFTNRNYSQEKVVEVMTNKVHKWQSNLKIKNIKCSK